MTWHHGGMPKPLPLLEPIPTADVCCAPISAAPLTQEQAEAVAGDDRSGARGAPVAAYARCAGD